MQEQIELIETQLNNRINELQRADPTAQRLIGQLEGLKTIISVTNSQNNGSSEEVVIDEFEKALENEPK